MRRTLSILFVLTVAALAAPPAAAQSAIVYSVSFPAPQHHYAQVELTLRRPARGAAASCA